jgi:hypothetical protein
MIDTLLDFLVQWETNVLGLFHIVLPCIDLIADHGGICFA